MNTSYSITSKFQVTIPKDIREKMGLSHHDRVKFKSQGNQVVISRIPSMQEVAKDMQADLKKRGWNKTVTNADMDKARDIFYQQGGKW